MKKVFFIILISFFNVLYGQSENDSIKLEIVKDLTKKYIENVEWSGKPSEEKQKLFDNFIWDEVDIEGLKSNLSNNNFSEVSDKITDKLYNNIDYNNSEEKVVDDINKYLKNSLSDTIIKEVLNTHNVINTIDIDDSEDLEPVGGQVVKFPNQIPLYFWVTSGIFCVIILILILIKNKKIKELRKEIKCLYGDNSKLKIDKYTKDDQVRELRKELSILKKNMEENNNRSITSYSDETPIVVSLDVNTNKLPIIKYVSKLIGKGWKTLSDLLDEKTTLYKLIEVEPNKFEFEVYENLSQHVINEVTNFPDDTLYNACDNYNSNLDFRNTITTIKKGIIVKDGDLYKVKEKAKIKFE